MSHTLAVSPRAIALSLLLVACGGEAGVDGGADDGSLADSGVASPREAALPELGPCPEGWAEAEVDGLPVCDPSPGGLAPCPDGQARFVGTPACEPIGGACPSGDFAEGLPARAVHVRPGASGDGSAAAPFGTIAEAIAVARAGDTVALSRGTFDEEVSVPAGVTLRGACALETRVTLSSASSDTSVLTLDGAAASDLTVADSLANGVMALRGAVSLERVRVESTNGIGVYVATGATLEARDLVVRGVTGESSIGVIVDGGSARLRRALVEATAAGVIAFEGGALEVIDLAVRDAADDSMGVGLSSLDGAISGRRVEITGFATAAAFINPGGTLTVEELVAREADGSARAALIVYGEVSLARAWLSASRGAGVLVDEGGRVEITDVVIDGVYPGPVVGDVAQGVAVSWGTARVERVFVRDALTGAVSVIGGRARLEGRDLTLRDAREEGIVGIGLLLERGGEAVLDGLAVERAVAVGVVLKGGSRAHLTNVSIRDTRADLFEQRWGHGIDMWDGELRLTRARVEDQREVAVLVQGGVATLEDVEIVSTRERLCAATTCADSPGGIGLSVQGDAAVTARGFTIAGAPLCGVQIAEAAGLDLSRGEIRDAAIGACVQIDGYDVARLTDDVRFVDTGTTIQTTGHYLPEPSDPLR